MAQNDKTCLNKLKTLRKQINWEIEKERDEFLYQFRSIIKKWRGQLPNLLDILQPEEIEYFLCYCIIYSSFDEEQFIEFVSRSGYKDEPQVDKDGKPSLRRTTPIHQAAKHKCYRLMNHLFQIYNKYNVNYTDESGLTHFHVACMSGCEEVVRKFLEFGQDPNCPQQKSTDTPPPILIALKYNQMKVVELLLKSGADPNPTHEFELSPLHLFCQRECDDNKVKIFFYMTDKLQLSIKIDAQDGSGQTSLHYAVENERKNLAEFLLSRGANPNVANQNGATPLNIIIFKRKDDDKLAKIFFDVKDERHQSLKVDAQDKRGQAPLHYVLAYDLKKMTKLLLRNGADPNLANAMGLTPLHIICQRISNDDGLAKIFFYTNHELKQTIKIDALDRSGRTPLHYALTDICNKSIVELLLLWGADPNVADAEGSTPLHYICQRFNENNVLEMFFEINDTNHQTVQLDARDKLGRTPLEWAVASLMLDVVNILLDRGADLSTFVFPTSGHFAKCIESLRSKERMPRLNLVICVLNIVEGLTKRGYKLDRTDASTIIKMFAGFKLFNTSIKQRLLNDKAFTIKAKKTMINSSLSLQDLIQLQTEEAMSLFTISDFLSFVHTIQFSKYNNIVWITFLTQLMAEKFCRQWVLAFFLELTQNRLPIFCCANIIEKLEIGALWNICLAVTCKSYESSR